ncbi:hypothetical protein FACS1894127_0250 [Clostridia bacterium]|nr:hypothetical protein FACS1894127_0250 [Clostridia bacterium]
MANSEKALDAFMGKIATIHERLAELQEFADNHMEYDPEEVNWGHVGTAGYYLEQLTELTDHAFGRGEYAK